MSAPVDTPGEVSRTRRERYQADGYTIARGVISPTDLAAYRAEADALIQAARLRNDDKFTNYYLAHRPDQGVLYDLYQRSPVLRRLAEDPRVLDVVREIYASSFYLFENSLIFKPKGAPNEVPWHQDFMYMTGDPDKLIVWIALDAATEESGCMRAIPGSHKRGLLPSVDVKGETHHRRTPQDLVNERDAVSMILEAGDVLFFHQALLHSSARVSGELNRRAFRFAVKTLDNSYTPRASPILLSVESAGDLYARDASPDLGPLHRLVRRVGRKLKSVGDKLAKL